jgi:hypothetical protein
MIPGSFNSSQESLEVVISSVREALLGSHQYSESYEYTLTIGRKSLVYSPKLIEYRGAATLCLERLIKHSNREVRRRSIDIIEQIGSESNGPDGELWPRILTEKKNSLDLLSEIIPESSFGVLSEIEDVAMHLWANNEHYADLEGKTINVLELIPRSSEYNLFKILSNTQHLIIDFNEVKENAPNTGRWSWLVHTYFRGLSDKEKNYLPDTIRDLAKKYKSPKEILDFLKLIDGEIKKEHWSYTPVIETWYEINPAPFVEIAKGDIDVLVPLRFRLGFHLSIQKEDGDYLKKYVSSTLTEKIISFEKTNQILQMIKLSSVDFTQKIDWYLVLIPHFDTRGVILFVSDYWRVFEGSYSQKDQEKIILPLSLILENDLLGDELTNLEHCIHFLIKNNILSGEPLNKIGSQIYNKLVSVIDIDHHEELLRVSAGSSLENILNFIEKRAVYSNDNNVYFTIIPYHGLNFLDDLITSYEDFKMFYSRLYVLVSKDLLSRYDIEHVTKSVINKSDESGKYYDRYISDLLKGGESELRQLLALSSSFDFSVDTMDIFVSLFEMAEKYNLSDLAQDSFAGIVFSYSWGGTIGQAPPAMVNRRDTLVKLKDKLKPGEIKTFVEAAIRRFNEDIDKHESEEE